MGAVASNLVLRFRASKVLASIAIGLEIAVMTPARAPGLSFRVQITKSPANEDLRRTNYQLPSCQQRQILTLITDGD